MGEGGGGSGGYWTCSPPDVISDGAGYGGRGGGGGGHSCGMVTPAVRSLLRYGHSCGTVTPAVWSLLRYGHSEARRAAPLGKTEPATLHLTPRSCTTTTRNAPSRYPTHTGVPWLTPPPTHTHTFTSPAPCASTTQHAENTCMHPRRQQGGGCGVGPSTTQHADSTQAAGGDGVGPSTTEHAENTCIHAGGGSGTHSAWRATP